MKMKTDEFWLLFAYNTWAVYAESTVPDLGKDNPSSWIYKKYEVPKEKWRIAFDRLMERADKLNEDNVRPSKEKAEEIFPRLEEILGED